MTEPIGEEHWMKSKIRGYSVGTLDIGLGRSFFSKSGQETHHHTTQRRIAERLLRCILRSWGFCVRFLGVVCLPPQNMKGSGDNNRNAVAKKNFGVFAFELPHKDTCFLHKSDFSLLCGPHVLTPPPVVGFRLSCLAPSLHDLWRRSVSSPRLLNSP